MDDQVQDEHHDAGIKKEEQLPRNELTDGAGYSGPTHKNMQGIIRAALEEHEGRRLGRVSLNKY